MSGIYGVLSLEAVDREDYRNLVKWNDNYGDLKTEMYSKDQVILGIKPERLKENSDMADSHIVFQGNKAGVTDSLVFSKVADNLSDERFVISQIVDNGIDSLKDINGEFAGAIWDSEKKELLLFRDHLGVRPLFYYLDGSKVVFSSDIRGITSLENLDISVDEKWIYYCVAKIFKPSGSDTEYSGVKCVLPGGYIRFSFSNDCIRSESGRYWIPGCKKIRHRDKVAYAKEIRGLVEDAVRIRANATNHRIGAELSGGLDSGVISLILAEIKKDCFYYSWSPGPDVLPYAEKDERLIIKDICDKGGIDCHFGGLIINFQEHTQMRDRSPLSFDGYKENVPYMYEYAFPSYVNTAQIYETAAVMQEHGVKFVFTGHSGDEGISHRSNPYELWYNHEYYRYLRLMFSRSSRAKNRIAETIRLIAENRRIVRDSVKSPIPYDEGRCSILNEDFVNNLNPEKVHFLFPYDPKQYIRDGGIRNRLDVVAFYGASVGVRCHHNGSCVVKQFKCQRIIVCARPIISFFAIVEHLGHFGLFIYCDDVVVIYMKFHRIGRTGLVGRCAALFPCCFVQICGKALAAYYLVRCQ